MTQPPAQPSPDPSITTTPLETQNNEQKKLHVPEAFKPLLGLMTSVSKSIPLHLINRATLDGQTSNIKERAQNYINTVNKIKEAIDAYDKNELEKLRQLYPDQFNNYEAVSKNNNDELDEELKKKLRSQEVEKMLESRQELDNKNFNQIFSRILTPLVFSGALDILEIFGSVFDNFGGDFAKSVGSTLGDEKVMGGFAESNKAFGIDKIFEEISKLPILNDFNQFAVDTLGSEYLSPISGMARDFMDGELAKLAFTGLVLANFVNKEVDVFQNYTDFNKDHDKALRTINQTPQEIIDKTIFSISKSIANKHFQSKLDYEYLDGYLGQATREENRENSIFILKDGTKKKFNEIKIADMGNIDFENESCKVLNKQNFKLLLADAKKFINTPENKATKDQRDKKALEELIDKYVQKKSNDTSPPSDTSALKNDIMKELDKKDSFDQKKEMFCNQYLAPDIEKELRQKIEQSQNALTQNVPTQNGSGGQAPSASASQGGGGGVGTAVSADLVFAPATPPPPAPYADPGASSSLGGGVFPWPRRLPGQTAPAQPLAPAEPLAQAEPLAPPQPLAPAQHQAVMHAGFNSTIAPQPAATLVFVTPVKVGKDPSPEPGPPLTAEQTSRVIASSRPDRGSA